MTKFILMGDEYIDASALSRYAEARKMLWADVPKQLRVTEAMIRETNGARDPKWLEQHLTYYGCKRAVPFRAGFWAACPRQPLASGFCASHDPTKRASRTKRENKKEESNNVS